MEPSRNLETTGQLIAKLRLDPKNPDLRYRLGLTYSSGGEPEPALEAFRFAARNGIPEARVFAARELTTLDRFEEAIEELRPVASDWPCYCDALVLRGQIYERDERFSEAYTSYAKAVRHNSRFVAAHAGLTRLMDRGFPMARPAGFRAPLVNEVQLILLDGGEDSIECRVRVFNENSAPKRRIVVLTATRRFHEEADICPNIACAISQVSRKQSLEPRRCRWIVLAPQGKDGAPMELIELRAVIALEIEDRSPFQYFLRQARNEPRKRSNILLTDASFEPLSHDEFVTATGYRFLWS